MDLNLCYHNFVVDDRELMQPSGTWLPPTRTEGMLNLRRIQNPRSAHKCAWTCLRSLMVTSSQLIWIKGMRFLRWNHCRLLSYRLPHRRRSWVREWDWLRQTTGPWHISSLDHSTKRNFTCPYTVKYYWEMKDVIICPCIQYSTWMDRCHQLLVSSKDKNTNYSYLIS